MYYLNKTFDFYLLEIWRQWGRQAVECVAALHGATKLWESQGMYQQALTIWREKYVKWSFFLLIRGEQFIEEKFQVDYVHRYRMLRYMLSPVEKCVSSCRTLVLGLHRQGCPVVTKLLWLNQCTNEFIAPSSVSNDKKTTVLNLIANQTWMQNYSSMYEILIVNFFTKSQATFPALTCKLNYYFF